jgi:hypothetical protein
VRWCRPEGPEFRAGIALNRVVPAGGGESGPSEQGGDRAQATSSGV